MPKPLNLLKTEAAAEAQVSTSDTTNLTKIEQAIRREYKSLWHKYFWREITVIDREISVASGVDNFLIDKDIGAIVSLTEDTNDVVLQSVSARVFQLDHLLGRGSTGTPWKWTHAGSVGVGTNLTANGTVKVVSDSASDTFTVRVHGQDTNDNYVNEQLTLNGTSAVSGSVTFKSGTLTQFSKKQLSVGTITLKDSSDTVLENVAPREFNSQYMRLKLVDTTDKAYTLYLTGKLRFQDMEYDEDVPRFDADEILVLHGIASMWRDRKEHDKANWYLLEAERRLRDLVSEKYIQDEQIEDSMPVIRVHRDNAPFLAGLG